MISLWFFFIDRRLLMLNNILRINKILFIICLLLSLFILTFGFIVSCLSFWFWWKVEVSPFRLNNDNLIILFDDLSLFVQMFLEVVFLVLIFYYRYFLVLLEIFHFVLKFRFIFLKFLNHFIFELCEFWQIIRNGFIAF